MLKKPKKSDCVWRQKLKLNVNVRKKSAKDRKKKLKKKDCA